MRFLLEGPGGIPGAKQAGSITTGLPVTLESTLHVVGNVTIDGTLSAGAESVTSELITVVSANAFTVGANGLTNPAFNVDTTTASVATGINIKGFAAGSAPRLSVLSSGTNESLNIDAKGSGDIILGQFSTGVISMGGAGKSVQVGGGNTGIANHFLVGPNTTLNPTFTVDTSAASSATGLKIKSAAAGGGLAVTTISGGTDENLTIAAKGAGSVTFNPAVVATAGGAVNDGVKYGALGVGLFTGTGAPTFSAMNGSIYTDSDATTLGTRVYVNKSGAGTAGTTWTAIAAVA